MKRKRAQAALFLALFVVCHISACRPQRAARQIAADAPAVLPAPPDKSAKDLRAANPGRVVHVVVALCDNASQGIVPVPAAIRQRRRPGAHNEADERMLRYLIREAGFTPQQRDILYQLVNRQLPPDIDVKRAVSLHRLTIKIAA